jgi:hypothetical protein
MKIHRCSVDPYLFENFVTDNGDFLTAKFRAFKFPDTSYVQFRGNVNVCLDSCRGVECSNGQIGYGKRRKRDVMSNAQSNNLFEISMSKFIKVDYEPNADKSVIISETEESLKQLKIANQKLNRNSRENFYSIHDTPQNLQGGADRAKVEETSVFTRVIENFETSGAALAIASGSALICSLILSRFI